MRKDLDWTKTGTIVAMGEWLRKNSDALAVVVVRVNDSALLADPQLSAGEAERLVADYMPRLAKDLELARLEKRGGGRLVLERVPE